MPGAQLGLLVLEAALMATLVLALFRARGVLGLSPLYIVMGGFQYLEATLSVQVELWPGGLTVYPGSSVMFTANLFAMLLVYLKEDAQEARKLVYGLVLANAGLTLVSLLVSTHFLVPGALAGSPMTARDFINNAQIAIVGASLLFVDVIGIILVYEYVSRFVPAFFVRALVALLVIVAFDNFFFQGFLRWGQDDFWPSMTAGLVAKAGAAVFYATVLWGYLRFVDPRELTTGEGDVADVFQMLTYRQKYEIARDRMIHDPLTGLYNRLHFDEVAPRALAHARRYREPLTLMIADGDHFKAVNDRFSHLEGDRVLRVIGEIIGAEMRAADIGCRYGGDEFVMLLTRTTAADAGRLAARLQARLREHCAFSVPPYPWGSVTLTVGIAGFPEDGGVATVEDLVRLADRRLYEGKRLGGNIIVAEGPAAPLAADAQPQPA